MANVGDIFVVELKPSHVDQGTYRHTDTREPIDGEGYIPIPIRYAEDYSIYNSNYKGDVLGLNLFNCTSVDGDFSGKLKAAGGRYAGDIYAKQLQGDGDLKALGAWFKKRCAKIGDRVKVTWISATDITIEIIQDIYRIINYVLGGSACCYGQYRIIQLMKTC